MNHSDKSSCWLQRRCLKVIDGTKYSRYSKETGIDTKRIVVHCAPSLREIWWKETKLTYESKQYCRSGFQSVTRNTATFLETQGDYCHLSGSSRNLIKNSSLILFFIRRQNKPSKSPSCFLTAGLLPISSDRFRQWNRKFSLIARIPPR